MSERWFPDSMPVPAASPDTLPWWQAAAEHRLVVQACDACDRSRHPPSPVCPHCRSWDARFVDHPADGHDLHVHRRAPGLRDRHAGALRDRSRRAGRRSRPAASASSPTSWTPTRPRWHRPAGRAGVGGHGPRPVALPRAPPDLCMNRVDARFVKDGRPKTVRMVLYDFDQVDGGQYFASGLRLGLDEVGAEERLGRPVELVTRQADGLPGGSAEAVVDAFGAAGRAGVRGHRRPVDQRQRHHRARPGRRRPGCRASTTRAAPSPAASACSTTRWARSRRSRYVLVDHLRPAGRDRVAVLHDDTPVGTNYDLWFEPARRPEPAVRGRRPRLGVAAGRGPAQPRSRRAAGREPDALVYLGLGVAARAVALGVRGGRVGRPGRGQLGAHVRLQPAATGGPAGRAGCTSTPSATPTPCAPRCASGPGPRRRPDRRGRLRHRPAARRWAWSWPTTAMPAGVRRGPGAGQAAPGRQRQGGHRHGLRPVGPRRAQGRRARAAHVARRHERVEV